MIDQRKVLMVSVGHGGNLVANAFLQRLLLLNGVAKSGIGTYDGPNREGLEVFCDQAAQWRPRRVLVDFVQKEVTVANSATYGQLYQDAVIGNQAIGKNFAKGFLGAGRELSDSAMSTIRGRVHELGGNCVIWLMHTLGGGCGSGLGSLLLNRLAEDFPEIPRVSIAVLPGPKVSDGITEPYNATLALSHIMTSAHQMICIDNQQLYDICYGVGGNPTPTYANLNDIISGALNTLVTPLIWPAADGRRMTLENFHAALSPAMHDEATPWYERDASEIAHTLKVVSLAAWEHALPGWQDRKVGDEEMADHLAGHKMSTLASSGNGAWQTMFAVLSGPDAAPAGFASRLPQFATVVSNKAPLGMIRRSAAAGVHSGVAETFMALSDRFGTMFHRKAQLRAYTEEGLNEMAFTEAESILSNLVTAYRDAAEEGDAEEEG